jgi:hypothetical protein
MSTSKATTGVLVGLVAATSFALPSLAGPTASTLPIDRAVPLSEAAEQQILQRAEVILARYRAGTTRATDCKPGAPGFDQYCTKYACTNDCGPKAKKAY